MQQSFQLVAVSVIMGLAEAHRAFAHVFNQIKGRITFLLAQRVAEDAPEQADIFAQRDIFTGNVSG